ncbi:hypothetical protein QJS83_07485 [Bdellovibrio sp. 22V]|uniref:hypothetical protein n=1 Tax=Bdellovibrio TaxID=958 RepID=UPI002543D1DA|nr:hypothetical protein [Bdellovibrio sp. 22V]WII73716.1 hypothetical protein QJS83_07485 [Bdellovibrio sp. 22V]
MTDRMRLFLRTMAFGFVAFAILAAELSLVGVQRQALIMRQPTSGVSVYKMPKRQMLEMNMRSAKRWAERLDAQSLHILSVSSMSGFDRWRRGVDIDSMKTQYSQDMIAHLKAMTSILKIRREKGGFAKLQEFDFQNMIRKSDYLLSLSVTKSCIEHLSNEGDSTELVREVLASYNQERMQFDHKMISIAEN